MRFRYPRWNFGPALCGVPVGVSRGFLKGLITAFHPRLGYVCVSEDMTEEFGLCGYFKEYDHGCPKMNDYSLPKEKYRPPIVRHSSLSPLSH